MVIFITEIVYSGFGESQRISLAEHQKVAAASLRHLVQCFGIPLAVHLKGLPADGLGDSLKGSMDRLEGAETVAVEDTVVHLGQVTVEVFGDCEGGLELLECHRGNRLHPPSRNLKHFLQLSTLMLT